MRRAALFVLLLFFAFSAFADNLSVTLKGCSGDVVYNLETAVTDSQKMTGLMNRKSLDTYGGMIFLYSQPVQIKFWMKNTLIPLDMLFLDQNKQIIYIQKNAEPLNETLLGPDAPFMYVIELGGGTADKNCIITGNKVSF